MVPHGGQLPQAHRGLRPGAREVRHQNNLPSAMKMPLVLLKGGLLNAAAKNTSLLSGRQAGSGRTQSAVVALIVLHRYLQLG